jgi:hypothetical protein
MEDLNFFLQGRFEESLPLPPSDFKSAALVFYYRASRSDYARPDCDRDGDLMWVKAEFKTRMPINIPFNEIEAFFGMQSRMNDEFDIREYIACDCFE